MKIAVIAVTISKLWYELDKLLNCTYVYYADDKKHPTMDLVLDEEHLVTIAETFDDGWDKTIAPALDIEDKIKTIKKMYKGKPDLQK